MTPAARTTAFLALAALGLSCQPERTSAPDAVLSANLSGKGGNADCRTAASDRGKKSDPVALVCTIQLPDAPITSTGKSWVDQSSGTYYLADRSNAGLFVIDIASHTVTGLITGFEGLGPNGVGPSSIVGGRPGQLWVSDGDSFVRLVDQRSGQVIASVSTAIAACGAACNRSNEIAYDPEHQIVIVSNPSPAGIDGYLTFISARAPYPVLGHLSIGPGTLEGQIWVPQLQRFLVPMQNPPDRGPFMAVVNPRTMQVEDERQYTCETGGGNNNLQLGPKHHLLAQLCGNPTILDVRTGEILNVITEIGTGDQDWYNPGDKKFYVFGQAPPGAGGASQSLGVIDAESGNWLQNVPLLRGAYPAVWTKTNELLARVTAGTGGACAEPSQGCIAVFAHVAE